MIRKKLLKKAIAAPFSERHFGVILENINSKLDLVIKLIEKSLKRLDKKIEVKTDKLDNRLAKVEFELREVRQDVKWMKENFLEKRIAALEKSR